MGLELAERVSSVGKDWHRGCLKCTKCGKTLSPGGHAEVIFIMKMKMKMKRDKK